MATRYGIVATRGQGQQLLVERVGHPAEDGVIIDTSLDQVSKPLPIASALKHHGWQPYKGDGKELQPYLGRLGGGGGKPPFGDPPKPKPQADRAPTGQDDAAGEVGEYQVHRRWHSREGVDPGTDHDAGLHAEHLEGGHLFAKALPAPRPPAVAPTRPDPELTGQTFHYHPATGATVHGPTAPVPGMIQPTLHDQVGIRPQGAPAGAPLQHGRVIGSVAGGVRVRYGATGHEENLVGPQEHRGLIMAPAVHYDRELPHALRQPSLDGMTDAEGDLPIAFHPDETRAAMRRGPQVGHRFREVAPHTDGPHPFGDEHEVVHIHPRSGAILLANRDRDNALSEMDAHDWHQGLQHHSFRVSDPNHGDEFGDHARLRKLGQQARPDEAASPEGQRAEDQHAAELFHNPDDAARAGAALRAHTNGQHGLDKLSATYAYSHGPLRAGVTHAEVLPNGRISVSGDITHHTEGRVGDFARTLARDKTGKLVAMHDQLELPAKHQGGHFAQGFNQHAEGHYRDLGVDRSELHADITVGKHAWAQHGYDFADNKERQRVWDTFKTWADHHGHTFPKRDHDKFRKSGTAWDLANYDPSGDRIKTVAHHAVTGEKHVDGHYHLGKAFLLNNQTLPYGWKGTKPLDPDSPHQQQAAKYRASRGAPKPLAKALWLKSRRDTQHPVIHHRARPAYGKDGLCPNGRDLFLHGQFLLDHDPEVAAGIHLHGRSLAALQKAQKVQGTLPLGPPSEHQVAHPGSRGGHWFYDDRGHVQYGIKPTPHHRLVEQGDHALLGGAHHRVQFPDHHTGALHLQSSSTDRVTTVNPDFAHMIRDMAPAARYGSELPPQLAVAQQRSHDDNRLNDYAHRGTEPHADPALGRRFMTSQPRQGDRFRQWQGGGYGPVHTVAADTTSALDPVRTTTPDGQVHQHRREDFTALVQHPSTRIERPAGDADDYRDMYAPPAAPPRPPVDYSDPTVMRDKMIQKGPRDGDFVEVSTPFDLVGRSYAAGRYEVYSHDGSQVELYDNDGNYAGDFDRSAWNRFLHRDEVTPTERGNPRPDEREEEEDPEPEDDDNEYEDDTPEADENDYDDEDYRDGNSLPHDYNTRDLVDHVFGSATTPNDIYDCFEGEDFGGLATGNLDLMRHEEEAGFQVTGEILDPDSGDKRGTFTRSFFVSPDDGKVEVHHDLMRMGGYWGTTPENTNTGFAAAFNAQAIAQYKKLGVDRVTVYADISIGKYVWARQGFDYLYPNSERPALVDNFARYAQHHGLDVPADDLKRLKNGHSWELAEYEHPTGGKVAVQSYWDQGHGEYLVDGEFHLGRAFLLDEHSQWSNYWNGTRQLQNPDHPTERQARKYFGGKQKGKK